MGVRIIRIINLVTNAPHNDRGMIFTALDHIRQVPLCPVFKMFTVAFPPGRTHVPACYPFILTFFPFIKSFILYQETEFITELIHIILVWVVTHPDGIATYFFEL